PLEFRPHSPPKGPTMKTQWRGSRLAVTLLFATALAGYAQAQASSRARGTEVTLKGSLVCQGVCISDPNAGDHEVVLFAIEGTRDIRAEVNKIMKEFYPDKGLDADAAQKLMDRFSARLKYYIAPDSPALKDAKNRGKNHYCMP